MTCRINWFRDRGGGEGRETAEAAALCPNPFSEISCSLNVSPPYLYSESALLLALSLTMCPDCQTRGGVNKFSFKNKEKKKNERIKSHVGNLALSVKYFFIFSRHDYWMSRPKWPLPNITHWHKQQQPCSSLFCCHKTTWSHVSSIKKKKTEAKDGESRGRPFLKNKRMFFFLPIFVHW